MEHGYRRQVILSCAVITCVLVGCSKPAWHTVFQDEDLGYKIGLPIGWSSVPPDIRSDLDLDARNTFRGDSRYSDSQIEAALRNTFVIEVFSPHQWDSAKPQFPMLAVLVETFEPAESVPEYLAGVSEDLSISFETAGDFEVLRIDGKSVFVLRFLACDQETELVADLYCARYGNDFLSFQAMATEKEHLKLMRNMVRSLEFSDLR